MEKNRDHLLEQLMDAAQTLPAERLQEVVDFAGYLLHKLEQPWPERGSAEAILRHAGTFHFEPGELARLLTDIDDLRQLDVETDG